MHQNSNTARKNIVNIDPVLCYKLIDGRNEPQREVTMSYSMAQKCNRDLFEQWISEYHPRRHGVHCPRWKAIRPPSAHGTLVLLVAVGLPIAFALWTCSLP